MHIFIKYQIKKNFYRYSNLISNNFNVNEEDCLENYWEHFMATEFEDYYKELTEYIVRYLIYVSKMHDRITSASQLI
jgi:hypothetical protein